MGDKVYFEITKFVKGDKKAYVTYSHHDNDWRIMGDIKITGFKFRMNAVLNITKLGFKKKERVRYVGE